MLKIETFKLSVKCKKGFCVLQRAGKKNTAGRPRNSRRKGPKRLEDIKAKKSFKWIRAKLINIPNEWKTKNGKYYTPHTF